MRPRSLTPLEQDPTTQQGAQKCSGNVPGHLSQSQHDSTQGGWLLINRKYLLWETFSLMLLSISVRYGDESRAFRAATQTSGRFFMTTTSAMLKPTVEGSHTTAATSSKNDGMKTSFSRSCGGTSAC